jgi:superoxide dismutase
MTSPLHYHYNKGCKPNRSSYIALFLHKGGGAPTGQLATAIDKDFGSFEVKSAKPCRQHLDLTVFLPLALFFFRPNQKFKTEISAKSAAIQGSGWGWLAYNKVHICKPKISAEDR